MCIESSYEKNGNRPKVHKEIEENIIRILEVIYDCQISLNKEPLGKKAPYGIITRTGCGRLRVEYITERHKYVFEIQPVYSPPGVKILCLLPVGLFGKDEQKDLKQKVQALSEQYNMTPTPKHHLVTKRVPLNELKGGMATVFAASIALDKFLEEKTICRPKD